MDAGGPAWRRDKWLMYRPSGCENLPFSHDMTLMTLQATARRRPVATAVACAAAQFLLTVLILKAGLAWFPPEDFGKVRLVAFASTIMFPMLLAQGLGLWKDLGLGWSGVRVAPVFLIGLLTGVVFLAQGVQAPGGQSVGGAVTMQFLNAFGEELLFRGVLFAVLLSLRRWQAIVLSGVLFGSMHLIHGVMDGDWVHAAWWALWSSFAGMMFAAVRYATGSLWLTIFLHMFTNLCMIYSAIEPRLGTDVLTLVERGVNVVELGIALYVIRQSPRVADSGAGAATPG